MKIIPTLLMGLMACMSSACLSSVIPDPAPADIIYRFSPAAKSVEPLSGAPTIRVDRPTAPAALRGTDIVLSPDGQRLATAKQAKWAENLPTMIQVSLFDEIASRETLVGVLPMSGARSSLRLHLTVRSFEAEFDQGEANAPLAKVEYMVTLSDAGSRDLLGTQAIAFEQRASAPSVSAIVEATDTANRRAMAAVVDWVENYKKRA